MKTTTINSFTGYDYSVAKCHLANWGVIYLDEYGCPMDVEEVINMIDDEEVEENVVND